MSTYVLSLKCLLMKFHLSVCLCTFIKVSAYVLSLKCLLMYFHKVSAYVLSLKCLLVRDLHNLKSIDENIRLKRTALSFQKGVLFQSFKKKTVSHF